MWPLKKYICILDSNRFKSSPIVKWSPYRFIYNSTRFNIGLHGNAISVKIYQDKWYPDAETNTEARWLVINCMILLSLGRNKTQFTRLRVGQADLTDGKKKKGTGFLFHPGTMFGIRSQTSSHEDQRYCYTVEAEMRRASQFCTEEEHRLTDREWTAEEKH